ncbi:uncharacterized protein LOC126792299 [Argentina anserina]|uniref:uncharacterized protein LOC126792299 n=1 Tax=Argentina anserina TaxID=57926 RepID=UPI002176934B|nr:uncharacterized protein LOC126792299 [Potentilla anserina]
MRGNQNPYPSHPPSNSHVPTIPSTRPLVALTPPRTASTPLPATTTPPATTRNSYTISSDHLYSFQSAIDSLQQQSEETQHTMAEIARTLSFQTQQFAAFRNHVMSHWDNPPPPPLSSSPLPSTSIGACSPALGRPHSPGSASHTNLTFGSFQHTPSTPTMSTTRPIATTFIPPQRDSHYTPHPHMSSRPTFTSFPHDFQPTPPSPPPNFPPFYDLEPPQH